MNTRVLQTMVRRGSDTRRQGRGHRHRHLRINAELSRRKNFNGNRKRSRCYGCYNLESQRQGISIAGCPKMTTVRHTFFFRLVLWPFPMRYVSHQKQETKWAARGQNWLSPPHTTKMFWIDSSATLQQAVERCMAKLSTWPLSFFRTAVQLVGAYTELKKSSRSLLFRGNLLMDA